jgi:hypothetical protein
VYHKTCIASFPVKNGCRSSPIDLQRRLKHG